MIDDELDQLEEMRGDLPAAVYDLKNQIDSIRNLVEQRQVEKDESRKKMIFNEDEIERHKADLVKFKSQLYQVRNNREYDALTKSIDKAEEEIVRLENENKALDLLIERLKAEVADVEPQLSTFQEELDIKESELKKIIEANEREEAKLTDKRSQVVSILKQGDYNQYMRVRKACNGKAIVTIDRSACTGCFNVVPPQRQLEIRQNKRLYNCESCGRLLVSPEISKEVKDSY